MSTGKKVVDTTHVEVASIARRNIIPTAKRKWGMRVTVIGGSTYVLTRGTVDNNKSTNGNWVVESAGGATPPGGADKSIQYNNGGNFDGFGTFDGTDVSIPYNVVPFSLSMRENNTATGKLRRRLLWPVTTFNVNAGNIDFNIFLTDTIPDSSATIEMRIEGISADGSEAYGCKKIVTMRKDGTADMVQVGATTISHEVKDNVAVSTAISIINSGGTDFLRITFATGGPIYAWAVFLDITYSKV